MSMKKEIIYTDEYALILSDEQIKDARSHWRKWHLEDNSIINQFPTYLTDLFFFIVLNVFANKFYLTL